MKRLYTIFVQTNTTLTYKTLAMLKLRRNRDRKSTKLYFYTIANMFLLLNQISSHIQMIFILFGNSHKIVQMCSYNTYTLVLLLKPLRVNVLVSAKTRSLGNFIKLNTIWFMESFCTLIIDNKANIFRF